MRSDRIKRGVNAAPQRSLLYALGLTEEEINKPLIGIEASKNDIVPGHTNIDKVVDAVEAGRCFSRRSSYGIPGYCGMRRHSNGP